MPNRIIKDSIRTSKSVNAMSDFQFRMWAYLITYVDDYGRGSADPELLKGFVFPRRKGVTESTIQKTLEELATTGSVILYEVDGEPYLCFPNWSEHQTVRNKVSKFPAPEDGIIKSEINCNQLKSNESKCSRNPIQSNPESRIQNPESYITRDDGLAKVVSAYLDKIYATPSPDSMDALKAYVGVMGAEVCLKAINKAIDSGPEKTNWNYINGILRNWQSRGVKCLADIERLDKKGGAENVQHTTGNSGKTWNLSAVDL